MRVTLRCAATILAVELAEELVRGASVMVAGQSAPGTPFDPDRIAETYWQIVHSSERGIEMPLNPDVVRLAQGPNLATVVTLMPDGQPQALLTWVDSDGDYILVNTEPQRQRVKNLNRDPRVTVLIHSADNPWDWAEVRAHLVETIGGQAARDHIDALSRKYIGQDYANPIGAHGRVILKIAADKTNTPRTMSV